MSVVLQAWELHVERRSRRSQFELSIGSLPLYAGEVLVVLGPNGAGKTTLLRALAGLDPIRAGRIEGPGSGRATLVFQHPLAFDGSVEHNVRVALLGQGLSRGEGAGRVRGALERFGIGGLASRRARSLSGGELRRLALARAFAARPAALLLDEPFEDLDASAQDALARDLRRVAAETSLAVALVTHDLRRAVAVSDRLAVLEAGRLLQTGPTQELLERPASVAVARRVGMTNLLRGRLGPAAIGDAPRALEIDAEHRLRVHDARPEGTPVVAGIRAEHLKLDAGRGASDPVGKARVLALESDGVVTIVRLSWAGFELHTHLVSGRGLARTLRPGDAVTIAVRPDSVRVLDEPDAALKP